MPRGEGLRTATTVRDGYRASKPAHKNGRNFYTNRFIEKYSMSLDMERDEKSPGRTFFENKKNYFFGYLRIYVKFY